MKIRKAEIGASRLPGDPLNAGETTEMKSIAGSLAWIARQCRPDLANRVSEFNPRHPMVALLISERRAIARTMQLRRRAED